MTDEETIKRLRQELLLYKRTVDDMRKKIKRQRLENGRLNASLFETKALALKFEDEIKWMKGE